MFTEKLTKAVGEFDNKAFLDKLLEKIESKELLDKDIVDTL